MSDIIPHPESDRSLSPADALSPTRALSQMFAISATPMREYWSYDLSDPVQLAALIRARGEPDRKIAQCLGEIIRVEHVYIHEVDTVSQDSGELHRWPRCVMIAPDGSTVASGAKGVVAWLGFLAQILGPFPWVGGRDLFVRSVSLPGGRRTYQLTLPPPIVQAVKKGAKSG